jgi:hypothetical protein
VYSRYNEKYIGKNSSQTFFLFIFISGQKMFSSNESHASYCNSDHFTYTSSDEDILEEIDQEHIIFFHLMVVVWNFQDFFLIHIM